MQLSKARMRVNLLAQGLFSEWRVFAATRAKGRLSLVKERGGGEVRLAHSIDWSRSPSSSSLIARREATKHARVHAIPILCGETKAQYPVVAPHQDPSNC